MQCLETFVLHEIFLFKHHNQIVLELEEDKTLKLGQSLSIARLLAKRASLIPSNEIEAAKCDMFCDEVAGT